MVTSSNWVFVFPFSYKPICWFGKKCMLWLVSFLRHCSTSYFCRASRSNQRPGWPSLSCRLRARRHPGGSRRCPARRRWGWMATSSSPPGPCVSPSAASASLSSSWWSWPSTPSERPWAAPYSGRLGLLCCTPRVPNQLVLRWSAVAPTCSGDAGQALHVASSPGTPTPGLKPGSSSLPAGLAPAGVAHS